MSVCVCEVFKCDIVHCLLDCKAIVFNGIYSQVSMHMLVALFNMKFECSGFCLTLSCVALRCIGMALKAEPGRHSSEGSS